MVAGSSESVVDPPASPSLKRPPRLGADALAGFGNHDGMSAPARPKAAARARKSRREIFPLLSQCSSTSSSDMNLPPYSSARSCAPGIQGGKFKPAEPDGSRRGTSAHNQPAWPMPSGASLPENQETDDGRAKITLSFPTGNESPDRRIARNPWVGRDQRTCCGITRALRQCRLDLPGVITRGGSGISGALSDLIKDRVRNVNPRGTWCRVPFPLRFRWLPRRRLIARLNSPRAWIPITYRKCI